MALLTLSDSHSGQRGGAQKFLLVNEPGLYHLLLTSGKLGSINHTLLNFEAIKNRSIALDTVLYNLYPTVEDKTIQEDTMKYIKQYLSKHFPGTKFEVVPEIV